MSERGTLAPYVPPLAKRLARPQPSGLRLAKRNDGVTTAPLACHSRTCRFFRRRFQPQFHHSTGFRRSCVWKQQNPLGIRGVVYGCTKPDCKTSMVGYCKRMVVRLDVEAVESTTSLSLIATILCMSSAKKSFSPDRRLRNCLLLGGYVISAV